MYWWRSISTGGHGSRVLNGKPKRSGCISLNVSISPRWTPIPAGSPGMEAEWNYHNTPPHQRIVTILRLMCAGHTAPNPERLNPTLTTPPHSCLIYFRFHSNLVPSTPTLSLSLSLFLGVQTRPQPQHIKK